MAGTINRQSDPRWDVLDEYVRTLAERIGLVMWQYKVSRDKPPFNVPEDGRFASAQCNSDFTFQTMSFVLYFGDDFFESDTARQRHVVTHELCHIMEGQRMACINDIGQWNEISDTAWERWYAGYNRGRELHIDWVATLLAPTMPLIQWGDASE